jgi:16S rRNA (uracil1498-N3)-methyltransferase
VPPRFYAPDLDPAQASVTLPASESGHLSRVLRMGTGDVLEVFDGRGLMMRGVVTHASSSATTIEIVESAAAQPEAPYPMVVCAALLKGDAMDAVMRDATVLGALSVVPMTSTRTNVPVGRVDSGRLHDRWQRVAVAAAKQCGRARLPDLEDVQPFADVLRTPAWIGWQRRLLVEPALAMPQGAEPDAERATTIHASPLVMACGPEGGWAPSEVDAAAAAGWMPWSLGPFTLRAEQVTLAALAVVRHAWFVRDDGAG